jgi:hypothetical protein
MHCAVIVRDWLSKQSDRTVGIRFILKMARLAVDETANPSGVLLFFSALIHYDATRLTLGGYP